MKQPEGTNRHMPNCGVIACAVITGQSFPDCFAEFKDVCGFPGQWRGRTRHSEREKYLKHKGYRMTSERFTRGTLKKWVINESKPGVRYIITLGSHVVMVENCIVVDQYEASLVQYNGSKQKQIKLVHRVDLFADHR